MSAASTTSAALRRVLYQTARRLDTLLTGHRVCVSHGAWHGRDVSRLARGALAAGGPADPVVEWSVLLAALLHDADDAKFFPRGQSLPHARYLLNCVEWPSPGFADVVKPLALKMVELVSTAKNGDYVPEEAERHPWLLIPRQADRLAAIGWTGVMRAVHYGRTLGRPLYTGATPRADTPAALWELASPERYAAYVHGAHRSSHAAEVHGAARALNSPLPSTLEVLYSRTLQAGCRLQRSDNAYVAAMAARRLRAPLQVALLYGRSGRLDPYRLGQAAGHGMAAELLGLEDEAANTILDDWAYVQTLDPASPWTAAA